MKNKYVSPKLSFINFNGDILSGPQASRLTDGNGFDIEDNFFL